MSETQPSTASVQEIRAEAAAGRIGDSFVILVVACFLLLHRVNVGYLSGRSSLSTAMSDDPLGEMLAGLASVLAVAYFALSRRPRTRAATAGKIAVVWVLASIYVILPAVSDMLARRDLGLRQNDVQVSIAHDGGVLQTEAAMTFLLQGISPYSADYHGTEVELGVDARPEVWRAMGFEEYPVFGFFAYPPGVLLLSLPVRALWNVIFGWYDQRIVYIAALIMIGIIGYRLPRERSWRLPFMTFLVLCPLYAFHFLRGMNDILCMTFLVAALYADSRGRLREASLLLGLACTVKQFAWLFVPLYLVLVTARSSRGARLKTLLGGAWPLVAVIAVVVGPFLVWDGTGLVRGLIQGPSTLFPIKPQSLGFSSILIAAGIVTDHHGYFPSLVLYLGLVAPLILVAMYRVYRRPALDAAVAWYAVTLFALLYFSRYFASNYLTLPVTMMVASWLLVDQSRAVENFRFGAIAGHWFRR